MGRRNRPRTPGKRANIAWPIIVFGAILIAAAVFLVTRPGGDEGGTPRIVVDQQTIDYGHVKFGETRAFEIKVTNAGDGVLRFREKPYIEVLEGCWPPTLTIGSMVLSPGESTTIRSAQFMMHAGMDGPHNFGLHLVTNDAQQPDLMVNVLSDWGPWCTCPLTLRDNRETMELKMAGSYKDPVCGMNVTPETAAGKFDYKGVTYYFCSPGCRRSFEKEPEKYLAPDHKPHM